MLDRLKLFQSIAYIRHEIYMYYMCKKVKFGVDSMWKNPWWDLTKSSFFLPEREYNITYPTTLISLSYQNVNIRIFSSLWSAIQMSFSTSEMEFRILCTDFSLIIRAYSIYSARIRLDNAMLSMNNPSIRLVPPSGCVGGPVTCTLRTRCNYMHA